MKKNILLVISVLVLTLGVYNLCRDSVSYEQEFHIFNESTEPIPIGNYFIREKGGV